ncbi:MAG: Ig-like domain-containing protein, partial [Roseburia sp.]|nr:Ig-like domain-containing protein [Roseburia sp.]
GQRINTWARLRDGNKAYQLIGNLFSGGMYVNLWDAHPPFQIDGNFGYTSGVAEMLMQSNMGFIDLLPALPDAWTEGNVQGLVTRGNFELGMEWSAGALRNVTLLSKNGNECIVAYPDISRAVVTDANGNLIEFQVLESGKISFPTAKGMTYTISAIPAEDATVVANAEALRTTESSVTVRWTGEDGVDYQVYRQVAGGDILPLDGGTTNPFVDETAYEDLGETVYYIQAEGCRVSTGVNVTDLRNMERVDDQYSLDGTNSSGTPIVYGGSWSTYNSEAANYKGTCRFIEASNVDGQTAKLTFLGTGIQAMGKRNNYGTRFTLAIDGGAAQSFTVANGTTANPNGNNKVLGEITGLDYGIHTVVLTMVSGKIDFDGFNVLGGQTTVTPPDDEDELEITATGGIEKLWNAGDSVRFTANLDGVTWTATSNVTHAATCSYPEHKFSWNADTQTLTAGLTDEVITVTATRGSQTASKTITITPKTTVTIVEDSVSQSEGKNSAITWNGGSTWWGESTRHHGGSKTESFTSFSYTFTGTGIGVYVQKYKNGGDLQISIDGEDRGTYQLYVSNEGEDQALLAKFTDLTNSEHTIVVTGVANGGRTGTDVDFLEVYAPNPNAPQADITALREAVSNAAAYNPNSYTEASWQALSDALETAGTYLNNTYPANQAEVDAAVAAINAAIAGLTIKPLTAPENVTVLLTESNAVTLRWDAVNGADGYTVTAGSSIYEVTGTTCRADGLDSGVTYSITVQATNVGDTSPASAPVSVTTLDNVPPTQPGDLSWNSGTLSWSASTDNVGVVGYRVLLNGEQQGADQTALSKTLTLSGSQNTLSVVAFDAAGNESAPATLVVAPSYTVTARNATIAGGKTSFKVGEAVTVTATVPAGSILTGWSASGVDLTSGSSETISFSMPARNVTVTASVVEKNWPVTTSLTNLVSDLNAGTTVPNGSPLTVRLIAYEPYQLPTSVSVEMGGRQLQAPWVTYDVTTGTIAIREVTGEVVITAENAPQTPADSAFTEADPFNLPANVGDSTKLEAEYMELVPGTGSRLAAVYGPNFGNQQLTGFVEGDVIRLYYNAAQPGSYTLTLLYKSDADASAHHSFGWSGEKVESYTGAVQNTLDSTGQAVYRTTELELEVNEDGVGVIEFAATGSAGPDIDAMIFTLDSISATEVERITLDQTELTLYLDGADGEDTAQLTATVSPDDATNQDIRWETSDNTVADVSQSGQVIARKNGSVTITAHAMDGTDVSASALVNVKTRVSGAINISGVPQYGKELVVTLNQVTHQEANATLAYQWYRDGQPIPGATDRHYTVTEEDIGKALTVTATATDPYVGAPGGAVSPAVTATKAKGPDVTATLDAVDFTETESGKIVGLNPETSYEYKLVSAGDDAWAAIPSGSNEFEVPAPGSYQVRVAATTTAT